MSELQSEWLEIEPEDDGEEADDDEIDRDNDSHLDSIAVSLFGWSGEIQNKSPNNIR